MHTWEEEIEDVMHNQRNHFFGLPQVDMTEKVGVFIKGHLQRIEGVVLCCVEGVFNVAFKIVLFHDVLFQDVFLVFVVFIHPIS